MALSGSKQRVVLLKHGIIIVIIMRLFYAHTAKDAWRGGHVCLFACFKSIII
jgi:hypothetical protein